MALSGSFTGKTANQYIKPKITWSATQSITGNYSDVTATLTYSRTNTGYTTSGSWAGSLYIDKGTDDEQRAKVSGKVIEITYNSNTLAISKTFRVNHNADGTKSITISATGSISGTTLSSTTISSTVALDTIPRTSTVSATNADIGGQTTITVNRASSSFTHTLTYSFAGLTGTIATKTTSTSISWTVPTTFYAKIPNAPDGKCTITCTTYNGTTSIGTSTATFTATANKSSCAPSVSVSAVDTNANTIAITGSNKIIVKGFSDVKVTTTATAKNSASISSVSVTCGTATKSGTSVTFSKADSATIKATATDSRGYPTSVTASGLTLVDYIIPTIIVESISRETPTSDSVNISVKGKWYNGSLGSKQNSLIVQVRYKPKSQESYTASDEFVRMSVTTNGNDYTASVTLTELSYTQAYNIQIRAIDAVHVSGGSLAEPVYKSTEINKGIPIFDWGEDDFRFNVPVILPKSLYFDDNEHGGLNLNNSDIVGANNILFADGSNSAGESIRFYRDGTNWDCLWAKNGNLYFTPNYPAGTTSYTPFYVPGDSVTLNTTYAGWVSGGSKEFYFHIPLSKPIAASEITLSGSVVGRGISGYVLDSNTTRIDLAGGDGYSVLTSIQPNGVKVILVYDAAQTLGITNNTIINWFGSVTIAFS